jgi:hypothetical protein
MARFPERDEYQVASLIGGLPVCTFTPKTYHRVITNIVVTNSVQSEVACYKGLLGGGVAVARNLLGNNNTLKGDIDIPAGQSFFVRWSAVGASVRDATARVSWERVDNPLVSGGGGNQEWSTNMLTSLILPNTATPNDAAIIIGVDLPTCMQANYAAAIFWRPANSLAASGSGPWFFIAQRKIPSGSGVETVDEGMVVNDGVTCGYVVFHRRTATYDGTNLTLVENYGRLEIVNMGVATLDPFSNPAHFFVDTDIITTGHIDVTTPAGEINVGGRVVGNAHNIAGYGTGLTTENAGNYVDWPTGQTITFEKLYDDTDVQIRLGSTFYASVTTVGVAFGAEFDDGSAPFDVLTHSYEPGIAVAGLRLQSYGEVHTSGIDAGTYTVRPRFKKSLGAGTISVDANDYFSLTVTEVNS